VLVGVGVGVLRPRAAVRHGTVHEQLVACDEADAEKVEAWLEKAMVDGMDGVLNGSEIEGPRVPVEVKVDSGKIWAG
jgi:hypothetical protein